MKYEQTPKIKERKNKKKVGKFEYLVEDMFNQEIISMTLSGKIKMQVYNLKVGEEVYVITSPFEPGRGRLPSKSAFKMDNNLFGQKLELDRKQEEKETE